jgi:hypothetical protein
MYRLHGYAIVSEDDRIADAQGRFPDALKNEADWAYFQAGLDRTVLTLLGRRSHDASPNAKGRLRLVMSGSVAGLERRTDAWRRPAGTSACREDRPCLSSSARQRFPRSTSPGPTGGLSRTGAGCSAPARAVCPPMQSFARAASSRSRGAGSTSRSK